MFSEVNCLVFLSIFLVYGILCMSIYRRAAAYCVRQSEGWEILKRTFLCGITALLLTVITIYLWFAVILFMVIATKYLRDRCESTATKFIITVGMVGLMTLVAVAGIQLMQAQEAEEEEEEDDAVLEDMIENGMAFMIIAEELQIEGERTDGERSAFGTCSGLYPGTRLGVQRESGGRL